MTSVALYKQKHALKIGDVCRYTVSYTGTDPDVSVIYLQVKNMENTGLRAIHLLNGPFMLYCHVTPCNYSARREFRLSGDAPEVAFKNQIKPGQTFNVPLLLNDNSLAHRDADETCVYQWHCDVISQIVLNPRGVVHFVFMVGNDLQQMRRLNRSTLTSLFKDDFVIGRKEQWETNWGEVLSPALHVTCQHTADLWPELPASPKSEPLHVVVLTHGLFSNLTADMLYLRDALYALETDERIFVAGCRENAGQTERGVHNLGTNVAELVTNLVERLLNCGFRVASLSFVGHSLGGPVQLYALKHILLRRGENYFKNREIRLRHFVLLACPMLGILSEMRLFILWFLDLGTLGKTGRDLTLLKKLPSFSNGVRLFRWIRPVLERLPDEPVQSALADFELLTLYANAVNDGIVPLRTSALLYLDWEGLGDVRHVKSYNARSGAELSVENTCSDKDAARVSEARNRLLNTNDAGPIVGKISEEVNSSLLDRSSSFFARIFGVKSDGSIAAIRTRREKASRIKKYSKISAKSSDLDWQSRSDGEQNAVSSQTEVDTVHIPPRASAVGSALSTVICPIPSRTHVLDPATRLRVIFHDKFYHHDSLPEEELKATGGLAKFFKYRDWRMDKQVRIARKYHAPGVTWRKVLVSLPPDAHNNIVVRRRFVNGYGWGVIEHLTENIFMPKL
ncbi:DUF676-domain-containing protein [Metschnikowia bicuspidata]|uniref:DUF676-domain-containing protein n=1 Tax=Metschnikowia bicuspidata TaxID=27322 RepID=A0A4P9ZJG4_9ASCO|nr:DUF676-domain-containing protein [Metschnikowia bicuspidata]